MFKEFDLDLEESHIINGHVPVESKNGESPIKANGRIIAIDGGFSRAYQPKTGIAGYTLIYNSQSLQLVSHEPFTSTEEAIVNESDILSTTMLVEHKLSRKTVKDTDPGKRKKQTVNYDVYNFYDKWYAGLVYRSLASVYKRSKRLRICIQWNVSQYTFGW